MKKAILQLLIFTTVFAGLLMLPAAVLADPIQVTVNSQTDWTAGRFEFNNVDASTSAGFIQFQRDYGVWDASGPANINHYISGNTKIIKVNQFLYIFRHAGNGQFMRYDMETREWKEMAYLPIEPNGVLDATTNGTNTIWAFATLGGRKHFRSEDVV